MYQQRFGCQDHSAKCPSCGGFLICGSGNLPFSYLLWRIKRVTAAFAFDIGTEAKWVEWSARVGRLISKQRLPAVYRGWADPAEHCKALWFAVIFHEFLAELRMSGVALHNFVSPHCLWMDLWWTQNSEMPLWVFEFNSFIIALICVIIQTNSLNTCTLHSASGIPLPCAVEHWAFKNHKLISQPDKKLFLTLCCTLTKWV